MHNGWSLLFSTKSSFYLLRLNIPQNSVLAKPTIMKVFSKFNKGGMTILMVTHSSKIANWADKQILMKDGRILEWELQFCQRLCGSLLKKNWTFWNTFADRAPTSIAFSFQYCLLEQTNFHFLVAIRISARHIIIICFSLECSSFLNCKRTQIGHYSVYLFLFNRKESNVGASPAATLTVLAM